MKAQLSASSRVFDQHKAIFDKPGLLGPNSRANMEQTWGQNGYMKNGLEH